MKITEITEFDEELYSDRSWILKVNGETELDVYNMSDCPEDAILSRGLGFVYRIKKLMEMAYEAGKNGETFEIDSISE